MRKLDLLRRQSHPACDVTRIDRLPRRNGQRCSDLLRRAWRRGPLAKERFARDSFTLTAQDPQPTLAALVKTEQSLSCKRRDKEQGKRPRREFPVGDAEKSNDGRVKRNRRECDRDRVLRPPLSRAAREGASSSLQTQRQDPQLLPRRRAWPSPRRSCPSRSACGRAESGKSRESAGQSAEARVDPPPKIRGSACENRALAIVRKEQRKFAANDAIATNIAASGPNIAAAKTVGISDIDASMFSPRRTRPRSASAATTAKPTTAHCILEALTGRARAAPPARSDHAEDQIPPDRRP